MGAERSSTGLRLFWVSLLALYLELLLIRWVSTEIRIFAYLQNTILVVCFLGLGFGAMSCRGAVRITRMLAALAALTLLMTIPETRTILASISELLSVLGDLNIWFQQAAREPAVAFGFVAIGLILSLLVMLLLIEIFVPLGRLLGRWFEDHPAPIAAYSWNVAGSLLGTWLFVLLSAWFLPPWTWFVVAALLTLPLVRLGPRPVLLFALAATPSFLTGLTSLFAGSGDAEETVWSPYQKLEVVDFSEAGDPPREVITVNNVGYQVLLDLGRETVESRPGRFAAEQAGWSQYDLPTRLHPSPDNVLLVGAGSGNDAAGALRNGAGKVTAVEIDPAIIEIGRRRHPERPYSSERVQVVVADARSFFSSATGKYDVIGFGLLDSHTTTAMTNARLDHYVYTRESLLRVRELLAPGGLVVLSFEAVKPFIADRMARVLREVFGHPGVIFRMPRNAYGWGGVLFISGEQDAVEAALAGAPDLARLIAGWQAEYPLEFPGDTPVATDDWPYLYLSHRRIPALFFLLAGLLLILTVLLRPLHGGARRLSPGSWSREHWFFAFLGAGFLLLEVQNISKASVVLGNTWQVNAVIISGVLLMVLLANLAVARWRTLPIRPVFAVLFASIIGLYLFDLSRLGALSGANRILVTGLVTTLPLLFAGILFIRRFALVESRSQALGANLLGALAGGVLQSASFLIGIRALLVLVLLCYLGALLTWSPVRAADSEPH